MFTLTKKLPTAEEDFLLEDEERGAELESSSNLSYCPVNELEWECVMSIKREMSWGLATIHIQRKIK